MLQELFGFFSLKLQIQMKALFKCLLLILCSVGYSVVPELSVAPFFPPNTVSAF